MQGDGDQEGLAPVRPLELEVTGGPAAGQQFSVHEDFAIGSAEQGPGALGGDRWLSASHALFQRGPDGWVLQDLRSLEGTKVNGRAVQGAMTLTYGDVVELGSSRIVVLPDGVVYAAQMTAESPAGVARSLAGQNRRELDGRRLWAFIVDSLVLAVPAFAIYSYGRGRWIFWMATIAVALTYYFLSESLSGRTLGKRLAGLRVARVDGRPLTPGAVATRTVLRLVDEFMLGLVGMLAMILSGKRRQRLGDLAARTAVVRVDTPGPRPERGRPRDRLALYAYPCLWIAPVVLLFALVPDARLLPCAEVGLTSGSGGEGACLVRFPRGVMVYQVANTGHTLKMPGFSVRLAGTRTRPAPRALRSSRYYGDRSTTVVGLKVAVRNTSDRTIDFDPHARELALGAPRVDGQMVVLRELPPAARPGFRSFAQTKRIEPGRTGVAWASFAVPPGLVGQLREPVAGLIVWHAEPSSGYQHYGEIRLWRAATPAGVRALQGLRG